MSSYTPSLKTLQRASCCRAREERGYKNKHEIPKVSKIVLNTGIDAMPTKPDRRRRPRPWHHRRSEAHPHRPARPFPISSSSQPDRSATSPSRNAMWEFLYACSRLRSRPFAIFAAFAEARRPGQLQHWHLRLHDLPGNHR